jgi:AraC-like DNA-binding protein
MKYKQIQPPDNLKNYVRKFWTLESNADDGLSKTFGTIADGCPGLIFQQPEKGIFYDQNNKQLPSTFLYGQTTEHTKLHSIGKLSTIGIYFYPHALKSIFGFDADELTNSCLDISLLPARQGHQLSEQLLNTPSVAEQVKLLSSYLFAQIERNSAQADEITQHALSQIIGSKGSLSLEDLQKNLHLSERSIERKFKQSVGISPKLFSRICRFQASLNQLRNNDYDKLSDLAFENDYADQSHLIRAFNEFAGLSPYQFQKQSHEVVENFPELK